MYLCSNYREGLHQKKSALLLKSSCCLIRIKKYIIKRPDFRYYDLCSRIAHVKRDMIRRPGRCYDLFSHTVRIKKVTTKDQGVFITISLAALYVQDPSLSNDTFQFLLVAPQPLVGHDLLIIEAS